MASIRKPKKAHTAKKANRMPAAPQWTAQDITASKARVNKYGGKMVFLDLGDTRKSPVRQFGRARVVYEVRDTDYEGKATTQRNMNLEMQQDDVEFIRSIEDHVIKLAAKNSQEWFGKKTVSEEVLKDRMESVIKPDKKGEFGPTVRCKVYSNKDFPQRDTVVREIVESEEGGGAVFVDADADAITKNSETVIKGEIGMLWISGSNFGLKIKVKDMILWPCKSDAEEESPFDGFQLTRRTGVKRPRSPSDDPTASGDFIPPPVKLARNSDELAAWTAEAVGDA